jgi:hypothetical protein
MLPGFFRRGKPMTPYLTKPDAELSRLIAQTPRGMMHWAGTCSDPSAKCSGCKHFGYSEVVRNDAGNAVTTRNHTKGCELYYDRMGRHEPFYPETAACKYFEARES